MSTNSHISKHKIPRNTFWRTAKTFITGHTTRMVIAVILFGIALRAVEAVSGNYLFEFDQGRDYLLVQEIVENGKLRLIGLELGGGYAGISGFFHGPGYLYLLAIPYVLFQGDPYGGMVLMFLLGCVTLLMSYMAGVKIIGRSGALLFLILVAISPPVIAQSRFIWNTHPSSSLILLVLYFVYNIRKNPGRYLPLSLFTSALIYHFQLGISISLILSICIYYVLVIRKISFKDVAVSAGAVVFAFLPFIVFEIRHGYGGLRSIISLLSDRNNGSTRMFELFMIRDHLQDYWFNFTKTFSFEVLGNSGYLHHLLVIVLLYGVFQFVRNSKKRDVTSFVYFLLITVATTWILLYGLLKSRIWDHYILHLQFTYMMLFVIAAIGIGYRFHKEGKIMAAIISIIFVIMTASAGKRLYINWKYDYHDEGGIHKMNGIKQAVDEIYHDADGKPLTVETYAEWGLTSAYDYAIPWYGKQRYGYAPSVEDTQLLYLFIRPDYAKPWAVNGWKETVVKRGEVAGEKELSSGFIVEKRTLNQ